MLTHSQKGFCPAMCCSESESRDEDGDGDGDADRNRDEDAAKEPLK